MTGTPSGGTIHSLRISGRRASRTSGGSRASSFAGGAIWSIARCSPRAERCRQVADRDFHEGGGRAGRVPGREFALRAIDERIVPLARQRVR